MPGDAGDAGDAAQLLSDAGGMPHPDGDAAHPDDGGVPRVGPFVPYLAGDLTRVFTPANGRYLKGQVKFGHLAKVVRGGEEPITAQEMGTYGVPAVETAP